MGLPVPTAGLSAAVAQAPAEKSEAGIANLRQE